MSVLALRRLTLVLSCLWSAGLPSTHAETVAPKPPATVVVDPSRLLSVDDLKAILAVAADLLEGDERVVSVEALDRDTARINIGIFHTLASGHGMKPRLHRQQSRWVQDFADQAESWTR